MTEQADDSILQAFSSPSNQKCFPHLELLKNVSFGYWVVETVLYQIYFGMYFKNMSYIWEVYNQLSLN